VGCVEGLVGAERVVYAGGGGSRGGEGGLLGVALVRDDAEGLSEGVC
jgi:hypothetical protein